MTLIRHTRIVMFLLAYLLTPLSQAEVTSVEKDGFVSEHKLLLATAPAVSMSKFIEDVHLWWDGSHSFGGSAAGFSIDARAGGCFCEQMSSGGSVEHLTVVNYQPGRSITFRGGLGPLQSMAVTGAMSFSFKPHAHGTELVYRYSVSGYLPGGLESLADPVDRVQLSQLRRLQQYIATGHPLNAEEEGKGK